MLSSKGLTILYSKLILKQSKPTRQAPTEGGLRHRPRGVPESTGAGEEAAPRIQTWGRCNLHGGFKCGFTDFPFAAEEKKGSGLT